MPKFTVEKSSNHNVADTFEKVKQFLQTDRDLQKMDSSIKVQVDEKTQSIKAKGSKFEATIGVKSAGASAKVVVEVDLPFLLSPLKGVIQSTIEKKLESHLA